MCGGVVCVFGFCARLVCVVVVFFRQPIKIKNNCKYIQDYDCNFCGLGGGSPG